jgi:hypothetical protein
MPSRRRNQLTDALQANRDLRNQLEGFEFPLQKRIRELEQERDAAVARSRELVAENEVYAKVMPGLVTLLNHLLASGKMR